MDYNVVGRRIPRVDGVVKATGEAKFTEDMILSRMLYGKILRSSLAHAKVANVNLAKAERLPGVKAVLTGKDTGAFKYGRFADKAILALDKVRYVGDEVAAVAAVDMDTAEEALDLIQVDYEELPPVFDPEAGMEPDAPKVHDHVERNISSKVCFESGDVEKGFRESYFVREDRFTTGATAHAPMEPHAALASFDLSGKLTVWASIQTPFRCSVELSKFFSLPESMVRVINPHVGGGFGGKTDTMSLGFCAAFLSKKTERPVRMALTREEVLAASRQRHPMIVYLKTGVKKDGTLMACHCKIVADGGAYGTIGPVTIYLSGSFLFALYRIQHIKYEGYRAYTNKPIRGPQRGHANPQPRFAADSQLDMIAQEIGIDPVEIRLKNALREGDILFNKAKIGSCGLIQCIQKVSEESGWSQRKRVENQGMGVGCSNFVSGVLTPPYTFSGATVKIHADGAVTVHAGISEIGQGSNTILAQIVAEELGISPKEVSVTSGDTESTPPHPGSFSNRGTLWAGNAVKAAAIEAKRPLMEEVAKKLEANPEDLEIRDRKIYVKGSPEKGVALKDAITMNIMDRKGGALLGRSYFRPDIDPVKYETGEGILTPAYSFDAQVAEVDVDMETGKVKVKRITVAHDCGLTINPMAVEGQVEGAVHMGLGQTLSEDFLWDEKGKILNSSFLDYKLLTPLEMPEIKIALIQTEEPGLPLGAKTSEGTLISTIPAVANAIFEACGARIKELPLTPDRVLEAINVKIGGR